MSTQQTVDHLLQGVGRRYRLVRGHGWIAHHGLPRPDVAPGTSSEVTLRSGERIHVDPADYIGRIIHFFGDLDPRISWICRRLLRPGDTVVDVGANLGVLTLLSAGLVGPTGTVHAFEPQPAVADLLRRSVQQNGFAPVHLHQMALSDTDTELDLHVPEGHLGGASLTRAGIGATDVRVTVRRAGALLEDLGVGPVRLLKIDIEGHEPEFLRGAERWLRAYPPEAILFELNGALFGSGAASFWEEPVVRSLGCGPGLRARRDRRRPGRRHHPPARRPTRRHLAQPRLRRHSPHLLHLCALRAPDPLSGARALDTTPPYGCT